MYHALFSLAGVALLGWALLIFLPTWRLTRRIAETAAFPLFLCLLYLIGIVGVLGELGPGILADFGSADGVLELLASGPVALVAWIHILAFDHLVGVLVYRDNMRHRFVPLPVQSLILFATLMLGPVGFLTYWAIRVARTRTARVAWDQGGAMSSLATPVSTSGEARSFPETPPPGTPAASSPPRERAPRFRSVVTAASPLRAVLKLWRQERVLAGLGVLGFALAGATAVVAAVHGSWFIEPEGRLLEAVKFDGAVGIYVLTVALILPLTPFSSRGRRRWVAWMVGLTLFSYGMETVQAWRGLNPRFTAAGGPLDQALGGVFFLAALGIMVLFIILMVPFFRRHAIQDHPSLRLALRYAAGGAMLAFGVGILMSAVGDRSIADGDLMLLHAGGFHALQAVPLVALFLGAGDTDRPTTMGWIHLAGAGWLLLCVGLGAQALAGWSPGRPTPFLALTVVGALGWGTVLVYSGLRGQPLRGNYPPR